MQAKAVCFKKSSVADLKYKLKELLEHKEIVDKYRADAQEYVCRRFNWDDVADRTMKLYKE